MYSVNKKFLQTYTEVFVAIPQIVSVFINQITLDKHGSRPKRDIQDASEAFVPEHVEEKKKAPWYVCVNTTGSFLIAVDGPFWQEQEAKRILANVIYDLKISS